jgi:hypothetical protein
VVGALALSLLALPSVAAADRAASSSGDASRAAHGTRACTIVGTSGDDILLGGPGRDVICGRGGSDRIDGRGGDDVLRGGPGADVLRGGRGADAIMGGAGSDGLTGGSGDDTLSGGAGNDALAGASGDDVLRGGDGNDVLEGGVGDDSLQALDGPGFRDLLSCGAGTNDSAVADDADQVDADCESNSQNAAPVAVDDHVTTTEDTRVDVPLSGAGSPLANDTDADGDAITVTGVSGAVGGTVAIVAGTIRFTPTANLCGATAGRFDYTVSDGRGGTDTGRVTVQITCVDDLPVAADDSGMVPEDGGATSLTVLANDSDPDGDPLQIGAITNPPSHGTVLITGGGTGLTYQPSADFCGPDSFTYALTPGGSEATVSLLVVCSDDAPVAVDDDATLTEDAAATAIPVLANDTDIDGGPKTISSATDPAHGTVVLTGGTTGANTGLTYHPTADYCGPDSFTYTLNGGSLGHVAVTITCVDDLPTAADDTATVDEDSGTTAVDVLSNDADPDGGAKKVVDVSDPAGGSAAITNGGDDLSYTPDGDFCGSDSFTYTVTGGSIGHVAVTVNCVNDAPLNQVPAGPVNTLQDTAVSIDGISVSDVDAGSDDVQVELSVDHGTLTLDESVTGGADALDVAGNGTSVVAVTATLDQINATLAATGGLVYQGDAGYAGPDTLTIVTDDLGHNGAGGALTDTDTLAITLSPPNAAPVAAGKTPTTAEETPKTITLTATDGDGDALTFDVGDPGHGTLGTVGAVTCDGLTPSSCSADVVYTPDANYAGLDAFTYTANDGTTDSAPASVDITVTPVNDAPTIDDTEATALPYTENDPATPITATTTVSDGDSANFDTGTLTVDYLTGGTTDDRLAIADNGNGAGQIGVSGSTVRFGGTSIGTFAGGTGTTPLVVTLDSDATPAAVQALVRAITYSNVSDAPVTAARTARFVVSDGDGGTSGPATRSIALTAVNDAPALSDLEPTTLAYTENDPATAITSSLVVTDADSNLTGATVTLGGHAAGDALDFVNQSGITGSYNGTTGVLTLTGSATPAAYQTALRSVKYISSSEDPSTATRTATFQVTDGPNPSNLSNAVSRDITVTAVNDAPVADDDPFGDALGNTRFVVGTTSTGPRLTVAGDVLAGDTDVDTPQASLTAVAGSITSTQCTGTCTGNVTMESDGQFVYDPKPGFTGTDTFSYTVTDNDAQAPANGTDTGTVTITVVGPVVWYVDGDASSAGDGRSASPSKTLSALSTGGALDALDGANDVIFVYDAASSYAGGLALESGQRLVGEPSSLDVDPAGPTPLQNDLVPAGGSNPVIVNASGNGLTLGTGNTIQGISLGNASGTALAGTSVGSATMNTVTPGVINNATGKAVDISGGTLDMAFSSVSSTGGTQGIRLDNTSGAFTASGGALSSATGTDVVISGNDSGDDVSFTYGGTISDDSGPLVAISDQTGGTKDFNGAIDDNPANGNGGGISVQSNNAATTTRFDGGLSLSTGTTDAVNATSAGTLAITDPGGVGTGVDNTLATTSGVPLTVSSTTIDDSDLTFRSIASNGAANGVVLSGTSNANGRLVLAGSGGTCSSAANCTGGAIQNSGGPGISLTGVPGGASLTRVAVVGGGDDGIRATTVNDVDLADSVVLNNGNNHAGGAEERGLDYLNVTGTPQIVRTTVSGSDDSNAHIRNTVAGSTTLGVDQSTFSDSKFNAGLRIRGEGSSTMNATVQNSTFSLNADPGFSMQTDSSNTAHQTLLFDSNNVSGGSANAVSGRPEISVNTDSASVAKVTISNNHVKSAAGAEIIVNTLAGQTAAGSMDAKVIGNTINDAQPGTLDAPADGGSSIWGWAHGDGAMRMEVRNNTVQNWGGRAIELSDNDGTGTADYTVTGNSINTPDATPNTFEGMYILAGGAAGDTSNVCVDLDNNTIGAIGQQGVSDIALDRFAGSVLRFAGFNDTSVPNLQAFLRTQNPASPALTVETFSNGPTATSATSCTLTSGTP